MDGAELLDALPLSYRPDGRAGFEPATLKAEGSPTFAPSRRTASARARTGQGRYRGFEPHPEGLHQEGTHPSASLSPKRRSSIGPVGRTHLGHRPRRVWPTVSGGSYAGLSTPPSAPVGFPARRARTRSAKEMAGGHQPGEVSGPHTFRPGREVPLAFAPPDARDRPSNDLRRGQEEDDTTRVKPLRRARDGVLTSGSTLAYLCRNGRRSRPELDERGSND